ncbi:CoA transferase [Pseudomaricurvus alkylphenolicus]|uniref:CaiB/BaiF CoA transferase family protein n=1 Tax=Pseudomaricurvus alkylphenolicus TaxID=1306991 RepID=UPI00142056FA|nr:CaiB/BaiF CoA-transferase family protein [Pseudomaricurvus alkylphenolicus]NIB38190.1 CoA transferase [Pseudomaricurvus alkylphenolicus]
MNNGPLAGIKVVEIAGLGPAPCAGMMLADMGAEVILIERKAASSSNNGSNNGEKGQIFNRGKKSIALNLKKAKSIELALELIGDADVVIEGFRPGVMERLGLGPEICLERNPALIYGRMTGWGQTGPLAQAAGHDPNYIALSGALWYGGGQNQAPSSPVTLVGDLGGGTMVMLWGIMCSLLHARHTGKGQVVDAAITDGSAYLSTLLWSSFNNGKLEGNLGSNWQDRGSPWNDTYECADGNFITVCALEAQFYKELITLLELTDDPSFADQWDKSQWPEGKKKLRKLFMQRSRDEWSRLLEGTDVCFGAVLNFEEAPRHPHNRARETFVDINGAIQPAPAPNLSLTPGSIGVPPKNAEHTEEILRRIGVNQSDVLALQEKGEI